MDKLISVLVFSTLSQFAVPDVAFETSFSANIEMVSEHSRIFTGERARLRCSVPDQDRSTWSYLWFRGSKELPQTGEELSLWNAKPEDSGKYYCQGIRQTKVGKIQTKQSVPMEINVDGGWAILQVPPHPGLVGDTLKVTCRVRYNPRLQEIVLYKDGIEVMRQNGLTPDIYLTNVSIEDRGMYSCRASWDVMRRTHSVISVGAHVRILEVLSQPVLEISLNGNIPLNKMKLTCHVQYNAPAPAPPINYYFYKNNRRLGLATSNNFDLVSLAPGLYSCKARVPELDLIKWSEPKNFGRIREPQMMPPPRPHHRLMPVLQIASSPDYSLPPATSPTATELSSDKPNQFTPEKSTPSQEPPLKTSQAELSIFPPTVQFFNPTMTPGPANTFQQPDNMSEESGDMPADPL